MNLDPAQLPDDIATLKAMLGAEHAARIVSDTRAAKAEARTRDLDAEIANLKLTIAKMRHATFGGSSERGSKLLDQLELQLADLVEKVAEHKAAAEIQAPPPANSPGAANADSVKQKPARRALPAHLPRERVVHPAPSVCPCCSGSKFRKLGEDTNESLELVPAHWKVVVHVREKMACRGCDTIVQAPAPSHPIARGRGGPHLLTEIVFGKYGAHLPLNRQSDIFAAQGIDLDVSTPC